MLYLKVYLLGIVPAAVIFSVIFLRHEQKKKKEKEEMTIELIIGEVFRGIFMGMIWPGVIAFLVILYGSVIIVKIAKGKPEKEEDDGRTDG